MSLVVEFDRLPEIMAAMHKAQAQVIRKAAFDVQARAQASAPVATGFLKSSIYTVTKSSSNYGQGAQEPPSGAQLLEEVSKPSSDLEAIVAVGASYGVYLEFGTSHMAAQPYLIPAAEAVQPSLNTASENLEQLIRGLVRV